jgi:hypothetical protein
VEKKKNQIHCCCRALCALNTDRQWGST